MLDCKVCTICGNEKPVEQFRQKTSYGKKYRSSYCRLCDNRERYRRRKGKGALDARNARVAARRHLSRSDGTDVARWILEDSRRWDRKHGFVCDLDKGWIDQRIANGCAYCGETALRMTLDRMDNAKGHTRDNVVPACIRCNYARRSMPYAAWLCLCKGVREAREQGLFGAWTGRAR